MKPSIARTVAGALISAAVLVPAGTVSASSPAPEARAEAHQTDERLRRDAFRFGCRVVRGEDRHVVRCRWQPIDNPRVAGYVVYRAQVRPDQLPREAIARVRAGDRPVIQDDKVRPGTAWVYAAVAVNHQGEAVAVSTLDRVAIPPGS